MMCVVQVLDAFLAPGSELWMFSEVPITEREKKLLDGDLQFYKLKHLTLVHKEGNAVIRRHLEMLPLETFDSVWILFHVTSRLNTHLLKFAGLLSDQWSQ